VEGGVTHALDVRDVHASRGPHEVLRGVNHRRRARRDLRAHGNIGSGEDHSAPRDRRARALRLGLNRGGALRDDEEVGAARQTDQGDRKKRLHQERTAPG